EEDEGGREGRGEGEEEEERERTKRKRERRKRRGRGGREGEQTKTPKMCNDNKKRENSKKSSSPAQKTSKETNKNISSITGFLCGDICEKFPWNFTDISELLVESDADVELHLTVRTHKLAL